MAGIPKHGAILRAFGVVSVALVAASCGSSDTAKSVQTPRQWFADISDPLDVSEADLAALTRYTLAAVKRGDTAGVLENETLRGDNKARIILLDVVDKEGLAESLIGSGHGVVKAIDNAASVARREIDSSEITAIRLEIVQQAELLTNLEAISIPPSDLGLYGLAFPEPYGRVVTADELMLGGLVDKTVFTLGDVVQRIREQASDEQAVVPDTPNQSIYRFTSRSVYHDGRRTVPLQRGHAMFDELSPADLLSAASNAGRYLVRSTSAEGRFVYEYDPASGRESSDYNFVRHAGTVYAMLELHQHAPDAGLLEAAERGIAMLLANTKPAITQDGFEDESQLCLVDEESEVKLGGNALMVLALAKHAQVTKRADNAPVLEKLCKWILEAQDADGRFRIHKQFYPEGDVANFESEYYPGEAILALTRAYEIVRNEAYLDSAVAAANYLIAVRDAGLSQDELQHDHWLLYGLNELHRRRPSDIYLDHAMKIARAIAESQVDSSLHKDWSGAFLDRTESNPTATRTEGLCAAWQLAVDYGRTEEAAIILQAVENAVRFQLQLQYRPESTLYLDDPARAMGAFRDSLSNSKIRIDTVQHNISALLCYYRILQRRDSERADAGS